MASKLYAYQLEGRDYLLQARWAILADEMGIGKTIQALAAALSVKNSRILVLVPPCLQFVWLGEIQKHFPNVEAKLIPKPTSMYAKELFQYETERIYIIRSSKLEDYGPWFKMADIVIVDEAHLYKNLTAKRTKLLHWFLAKHVPKYCFLLTGTPIKNYVPELYSLLRICTYSPLDTNGLRVTEYFSSYSEFCLYFAAKTEVKMFKGQHDKQQIYTGLRNEKNLWKLLKGKYLRRLSDEVLDLPPLIYSMLKIAEIDAKVEARLRDAFENFIAGVIDDTVKSVKLEAAMQKVPATVDYLLMVASNNGCPVLVASDHVMPAQLIAKMLSKHGHRVCVIHGEVSNLKDRMEIVADFQAGDVDFLVVTIETMQLGYTLTAANRLVYNDQSWVPSANLQMDKRIHRVSQTRRCWIDVITAPGFDEVIQQRLEEKKEVIRRALDNPEVRRG